MTTCEAVSPDLVALARGELEPGDAAAVETHVAACAGCAAELTSIRSVAALVRQVEIEPAADWNARLAAAVDAEIEATPVPAGRLLSFGDRLRDTWEFVQWRCERSAPLRRFVTASIVAHAAALLFVAWMLVDGRLGPGHDMVIRWEPAGRETARLEDDTPLPAADEDPLGTRRTAGAGDAADPLVTAPGAGSGSALNYPSLETRVRIGVVFDSERRAAVLRERVGDLAGGVPGALDRGLDWLAEHQSPGGGWAPSADAHPEERAGLTATALIAFAGAGRSSVQGDDAAVLGAAVDHLEGWLTGGVDRGTARAPVTADALVVRALVWQYAVDHRHLGAEDRLRRRELLRRAGRELAAAQQSDGGFGSRVEAGSEPHATLAVAEALDWLRAANVLDTSTALDRALAHLGRSLPGAETPSTDLALTASVLALGRRLDADVGASAALLALEGDLVGVGTPTAAQAVPALTRSGRPIDGLVRRLLDGQAPEGSWGDAAATAAVLAGLEHAYLP